MFMKVIIIGENAKEQALASALERTGKHQILVCPGNPGTSEFEQSMEELPDFYDPTDILNTVVQVNPDAIIILDEYLIRDGWKERLTSRGWNVIAPDSKAGKLLDDKPFWADLMKKCEIPVADFRMITSEKDGLDFIEQFDCPLVFKETHGKKRFAIPYNSDEAAELVSEWFADGCENIMVSEFVEGQRFNLPVFVWKDRILPLLPFIVLRGVYEEEDDAQAKGMGTICQPDGDLARVFAPAAVERILVPFVKEIGKLGIEYTGILSGEFIATNDGPVCVNLKSGLSETGASVLSPLLESDLLDAWQNIKEFKEPGLKWSDHSCVSLVMAANDYPQAESVGAPIEIDEDFEGYLYYNHSRNGENGLETAGGRVLIVSDVGKTVADAAEEVLDAASHIHCDQLFYRKDIGKNC